MFVVVSIFKSLYDVWFRKINIGLVHRCDERVQFLFGDSFVELVVAVEAVTVPRRERFLRFWFRYVEPN